MFAIFYSLHNFATQNCASSPFEALMKRFFPERPQGAAGKIPTLLKTEGEAAGEGEGQSSRRLTTLSLKVARPGAGILLPAPTVFQSKCSYYRLLEHGLDQAAKYDILNEGEWKMGLCASDTYEEICEKLLEFGLSEDQLEEIKAMLDEYADETFGETEYERENTV
jgi:hypothetical protein